MTDADCFAHMRESLKPRGTLQLVNLASHLGDPRFHGEMITAAIDEAERRVKAVGTFRDFAAPLNPLEVFALQVMLRASGLPDPKDVARREEAMKRRAEELVDAAMRERIEAAWSRESAMDPESWSEDNPAKNQCAVTAALIFELTGLPIVRGRAYLPDGQIDSHYWNEGLDLTLKQYPEGTVTSLREGVQGQKAYAYLLTNPDLLQRLEALRRNYGLV